MGMTLKIKAQKKTCPVPNRYTFLKNTNILEIHEHLQGYLAKMLFLM